MSKSLYKINVALGGLHPKAFIVKLKIERMVNQAIKDFYYSEEGDFSKFYYSLNIIKTNFTQIHNDIQTKILLDNFLKDIKAFKSYLKNLKKINIAFYSNGLMNNKKTKNSNFNNY